MTVRKLCFCAYCEGLGREGSLFWHRERLVQLRLTHQIKRVTSFVP
jgi:hypothetical protein